MKHRSYRGKVQYLGDTAGERGREWFNVTVQDNGDRTIRTISEMDDSEVLRDVTYTVDADFRPVDAFIRLTAEQRFMGTGWFRFSDHVAEAEVFTADAGRIHQRIELGGRARSFGCHPVVVDAWHLPIFDRSRPDRIQEFPGTLMSSPLPNGASGPLLGISTLRIEHVGSESVTVPAGSFDTEHFRFLLDDAPPEELWVVPGDWLMVQIRWDLLKTTYQLCELEGDI